MILVRKINTMFKLVYLCIFLTSFYLFSEDVLRPSGEISSAYNDYYNWSPPVNLGVEAGITYNYFSFNQFTNLPPSGKMPENYRQGNGYSPYALLILDYRLNGYVGVQLGAGYQEVNYSNKSNSFDYKYPNSGNYDTIYFNSDWSKKIGYLHSRLGIRYNLTHKILLNLGGFFNYKITESDFNNKLSIDYNQDSLLYTRKMYEAFTSDVTEKILYGISAGAEYKWYLTDDLYLNIHGQYQFSFKNALNDKKVFPRLEKIYQYFEFTGRQNQLFSLGLSIIYKY